MRMFAPAAGLLLSSVFITGCGSSGGASNSTPSTPSAPSTPAPPANRAPLITSMNFAPSFGIAQLTPFSFNAAASDPDGDAVTYSWSVGGNPFTGTNGTITFATGGNGLATLTVTDSKGATATDTRTFVVGSMTGNWNLVVPNTGTLAMSLTQTTTFIAGAFTVAPGGFGNAAAGSTGRTDPAQPGTIDGNGRVLIRLKIGVFLDATITGTMDSSGQRVTGSITGSGFSGQPFTMTKQ